VTEKAGALLAVDGTDRSAIISCCRGCRAAEMVVSSYDSKVKRVHI
jgi:hypothetical protein